MKRFERCKLFIVSARVTGRQDRELTFAVKTNEV
jgi:hypothetical protein